jgi:ABC-type nitrate/sulfonate/bicarbonate transport system substrate-binding protein
MKIRKIRIPLVLFTVLFFVFGQPVEGQEIRHVLIATPSKSLTWFPIYGATHKGFFREQGLAPVMTFLLPRIAVSGLISKEVPYTTSINSAASAAGRGLPVSTLMVLSARSSFVLIARPEIASPLDLRGKSIGITQAGSAAHRQLLLILKKFNIAGDQVKLLGLGAHASRVAALKGRRVDAVIVSTPYEFDLEREGFKRLINFKDVMEFPVSGLATHNDRLRENPEEVKKILTAILKGVAYAKNEREEVLPLIKEFIGLDNLEMAAAAHDMYKDIWSLNGLASEEGIKTMLAEADVPATTPKEKIIDLSLLKEVLATTLKR